MLLFLDQPSAKLSTRNLRYRNPEVGVEGPEAVNWSSKLRVQAAELTVGLERTLTDADITIQNSLQGEALKCAIASLVMPRILALLSAMSFLRRSRRDTEFKQLHLLSYIVLLWSIFACITGVDVQVCEGLS